MPEPTESVEADTALGKFKVSGANVSLLLIMLVVVLSSLNAWTLYAHAGDAKDTGRAVAQELKEANKEVANTLKESNKEIAKVLNELSTAIREQNCLSQFPTAQERAKNAELCKRLSR